MKKVYFVRHGESRSNASRVLEGAPAPLTPRGKEQSSFLAQRFANISVDFIIASPFARTKQTADIFNTTLGKNVVHSDLFVECRYPSEEYGLHITDERRVAVRTAIFAHRDDPDWRYSDEETLTDLAQRGRKALAFLTEQKAEKIVVISHGIFLKVLVSCMMTAENNVAVQYMPAVFKTFFPSNTGITLCKYDPESISPTGWQVVTWNDHAHLGDPND